MKPIPGKVALAVKENKFLFSTIGKLYYFGVLGQRQAFFDIGTKVRSIFPDEDVKAIRALKGTCSGQCFIVGNGPSLRTEDLERIYERHIPSFAANKVDPIFSQTNWRPNYYVCQDKVVLKTEQYFERVLPYKLNAYFFAKDAKSVISVSELAKDANVFYYRADVSNIMRRPNDCSDDVSLHVASGFTVTYAAMQLAMYMGYTELMLIGVDCDYPRVVDRNGIRTVHEGPSHFKGSDQREDLYHGGNVDGMRQAYENAQRYALEHGVKIYNATRGGKLEVFERVDFDELMKMKTE